MQVQTRFHHLDSARGIAALMVALYHLLGGYGNHRIMGKTEFNIVSTIFNGDGAVSFFFVLSGFVLSYRYFLDDSLPNYPKYIIARIFRLFPAYWFMLLVFILYINRNGYEGSLPWADYIREASMCHNFSPLLGLAWSLNIELPASILLPIFIVAAQREIRYMYYLLPIVLVFHFFIPGFFFNFVLGIIVAYWLAKTPIQIEQIYHWLKKYRWFTLPMILMTFSLGHIWKLIFRTPLEGYDWFKDYTGIDFYNISGIASCFILIVILQSKTLCSFLNKSVFLFLGKISYSLYICHWFFLFTFVGPHHDAWKAQFQLNDVSATVLVSFATLVISLIFATFMYYFIEKPFIHWGRKLTVRLAFKD
jgi:peptidoglycan/LPS O-acetylase OafA/YrhL